MKLSMLDCIKAVVIPGQTSRVTHRLLASQGLDIDLRDDGSVLVQAYGREGQTLGLPVRVGPGNVGCSLPLPAPVIEQPVATPNVSEPKAPLAPLPELEAAEVAPEPVRDPRIPCEYCGERFKPGAGMAAHIRRHHPETRVAAP